MGLVVVGRDASWRKRVWGDGRSEGVEAGGVGEGDRGGPGGGVEAGVVGCHDGSSVEEEESKPGEAREGSEEGLGGLDGGVEMSSDRS
jgi:hypothetical protein